MNRHMDISPNYSTDDWNRLNLSDPFANDDHWEKAIEIFEDRIRGRFLNIVGNIQTLPYSGFVVMAVDCLLIETLEQFYRGVPDSVGGSRSFFTHFFERSDVLKKEFTENQRKLFYEHFRCGILHQAELKGDSLVWKVGPLVWDNTHNGITVNRQKLHEILVCEFNAYTQKLREKMTDSDLKLKFRTKMDYICRKPQYYFSYRLENDLLSQELGPITTIGEAVLKGFEIAQTKKGKIFIKPKEDGNSGGKVYELTPEQLDLLGEYKKLEKAYMPFPMLVECLTLPNYQMVFVYTSNEQEN